MSRRGRVALGRRCADRRSDNSNRKPWAARAGYGHDRYLGPLRHRQHQARHLGRDHGLPERPAYRAHVTLVTQYVETVNLEAQPESSSALSAVYLDPRGGPSADLRGIVTAPDAVSGSFTSSLVNLLRREGEARATSVFAQDAWRPFARLIVTPGARITGYDLTGRTYFDPRVNATCLVQAGIPGNRGALRRSPNGQPDCPRGSRARGHGALDARRRQRNGEGDRAPGFIGATVQVRNFSGPSRSTTSGSLTSRCSRPGSLRGWSLLAA